MASALFLHNAIFIPDDPPSSSFPHSRTISSGTLQTIETNSSHPTEPLLTGNGTIGSQAYQDIISQQPGFPSATSNQSLVWDDGASSTGRGCHPSPLAHSLIMIRRLGVFSRVKIVFEVVLGVWAIYNTIRYFIAYTTLADNQAQVIALVLGTLTATSFAFFVCSTTLTLLEPHLIESHIPSRSVLLVARLLHCLAYMSIIVPALVNLAFVVAWRGHSSQERETSFRARCAVDVDFVWSVPNSGCPRTTPPSWTLWIVLSVIRVLLTLTCIVIHFLSAKHFNSLQKSASQPFTQSHKPHIHRPQSLRFGSFDQLALASPPMSAVATFPVTAPVDHRTHLPLSPQSLVASAQSHGLLDHHTTRVSSRKSPSRTGNQVDENANSFLPHDLDKQEQLVAQSPAQSSTEDHELFSFVDRFRVAIQQIHQETEDALEFAQRERQSTVSSPSSSHEDHDLVSDANTRIPPHTHGYSELGHPYPPDPVVPFLNGYVRRMPTIESLGSREMGTVSSMHSGMTGYGNVIQGSVSIYTLSRPPTRTNTLISVSSGWEDCSPPASPSRTDSLRQHAPVGVSDMGELVSDSVHLHSLEQSLLTAGSRATSNASGSWSTLQSYHTAGSI